MARFDTIIRGLARGISKTQRVLDEQAVDKVREYREDEIKSLFSAPKGKIKHANLNLKFAVDHVVEDEDPNDPGSVEGDVAHLNLIFRSEELAELSKEAIQSVNVKIRMENVDIVSDTEIPPPNDIEIPDDTNDPDPSHDHYFFIHSYNQGGISFEKEGAENVVVFYRKETGEFHELTMTRKDSDSWEALIPVVDDFKILENGEVIHYYFTYTFEETDMESEVHSVVVSGVGTPPPGDNFSLIEYNGNRAKARILLDPTLDINYLQFRYSHTNDPVSPTNEYHVPVQSLGDGIYEAELNHGSKFEFSSQDQIAFYLYYQVNYIEKTLPRVMDVSDYSTWKQHTYVGGV